MEPSDRSKIVPLPVRQKRGKEHAKPIRYVSCDLIDNLLAHYGEKHPKKVGRVELRAIPGRW